MVPPLNILTANAANPSDFGFEFDQAWAELGFVSVVGYEKATTLGSKIDPLKTKLFRSLREFMDLPLEVKMKYHLPGVGGQRGYTPNGTEESGGDSFTEYREHFMVGPRIPEDHPIRQYQKYGLYLDNPHVSEVPDFVSTAEELYDALEELDLFVFENLAEALGLNPGYFSSTIAYGDSSLRLHSYPALPKGAEILRTKKTKGVDTLDVRFSDGTVVNNLVRAGRHTDVDFSAALLGAEAPGLSIESRTGSALPYTAQAGNIVYNAGDYAQRVSGDNYPSSPHWVGLTPENAKRSRLSIVRFTHPRSRSVIRVAQPFRNEGTVSRFPDEFEGVLLANRLCEIGYFTNAQRDLLVDKVKNQLKPDELLVDDIVAWERVNHVAKLARYVGSGSEYKTLLGL